MAADPSGSRPASRMGLTGRCGLGAETDASRRRVALVDFLGPRQQALARDRKPTRCQLRAAALRRRHRRNKAPPQLHPLARGMGDAAKCAVAGDGLQPFVAVSELGHGFPTAGQAQRASAARSGVESHVDLQLARLGLRLQRHLPLQVASRRRCQACRGLCRACQASQPNSPDRDQSQGFVVVGMASGRSGRHGLGRVQGLVPVCTPGHTA